MKEWSSHRTWCLENNLDIREMQEEIDYKANLSKMNIKQHQFILEKYKNMRIQTIHDKIQER